MAEESQSLHVPAPDQLDFNKKNGADNDDDDHDLFKSAMESPMTDSDRTVHGDDEIDLNDDDDFDSSSSPSGIANDGQPNNHSPSGSGNDLFGNHVGSKNKIGDVNTSNSNGKNAPELNQTEPYLKNESSEVERKNTDQFSGDATGGTRSDDNESHADAESIGDPSQFLEVTITDPQKQGDGMSSFLVYRVTTRTNIALFRRKEFAVWRRFSDFLGLHSKLADKYLRKGRIVPPAPEKNVIGTTKIKISGQADSPSSGTAANQGDFVERRRHCLERFLNRVAVHPVLRIDPDFRDFLEIDSDLPKSTSTSALSGAGVARFFTKVGETMSKISYKMDESDPWFEEKIQNIEALENQLRKVHNSVELLVANRKDLAHSTGIFAKSAAILSNAEEHTGLARALAQLADVEDKVEQMHNDQANTDFFLFAELLRDYVSLIGSVKEVFHERVKAYQGWQHAQQMLNKKREMKAKLELQVRNDKVAQAREEVVEWEGKVEKAQEEFESISKVIKKELETFELARVKDFKKTIVKYLESLLSHQHELVKYWEAFLPEAKAIA